MRESKKHVFTHEKPHKTSGFGNDGFEHAKVYLMQFQDAKYKTPTNETQYEYAGSQYAAAGKVYYRLLGNFTTGKLNKTGFGF
ncbi:MAG: hypothetical protein IPJ60_10790 [Sphingobacteriaceae bacterium]|nr:hypothetical protein [Sphingobacteriaceae bacterium]